MMNPSHPQGSSHHGNDYQRSSGAASRTGSGCRNAAVLLIYPPVGTPFFPYLSLPTLGAYLHSRGVQVELADLNIDLFHQLLTPENIRSGRAFALDRIAQLGSRRDPGFREIVELARHIRTLQDVRCCGPDVERVLDRNPHRPQQPQAVYAAIRLASSSHFPYGIDVVNHMVKHLPRELEYSTQGIVRSAARSGPFERLLDRIVAPVLNRETPAVVGISVCFADQLHPAFYLAAAIRKALPHVHVTLGGAFLSCHLRNVRQPQLFDLVDSLILDDGEIPLLRLIEELATPRPRLEKVPGLIYRSGDRIVRNPPPSPAPLSSLPPPDFTLLDLDRYLVPSHKMILPLRLSRGCPWGRCTFCQTRLAMIRDYDPLNPDTGYEHLRWIMDTTGVRRFVFTDNSCSPQALERICGKLISAGRTIHWSTHLRFDPQLNMERCMLFRQSGCRNLTLGLESYNNRLLRLMKKGIHTDLVDRVLSNLSWAGLPASAYMMVGLPTETEGEALHSFEKIVNMKREGLLAGWFYNPYQIVPHSPMAISPARFGITQVARPEAMDLDPPIYAFQATGMARNRILDLGIIDDTVVSSFIPRITKGSCSPWDLDLEGRTLRLRHGLDEIGALLNETYRHTPWESVPTFGQWMLKNEKKGCPWRRSHHRAAPALSQRRGEASSR